MEKVGVCWRTRRKGCEGTGSSGDSQQEGTVGDHHGPDGCTRTLVFILGAVSSSAAFKKEGESHRPAPAGLEWSRGQLAEEAGECRWQGGFQGKGRELLHL